MKIWEMCYNGFKNKNAVPGLNLSSRKSSVAANQSINITVGLSYSQSNIFPATTNCSYISCQSNTGTSTHCQHKICQRKCYYNYWLKVYFTFQSFFTHLGYCVHSWMPTTPLGKSEAQTNTFWFSQVCVNALGVQNIFSFLSHINFFRCLPRKRGSEMWGMVYRT